MKHLKILIFALLAVPALVFAEPQLLDRVAAVVNDEVITQSELDSVLRPIYEQYQEEYGGDLLIEKLMDARQKLLNQLIEDKLVYQEAERQGVQIDEEAIDAQIEQFKKRFEAERHLEDALNEQGLSFKDLRDRFRRQLMIRYLHDKEIRSKIVVSPTEVEEYYATHASEFSDEEQVKVLSITLKKSFEARQKGIKDEEALGKMDEIRKKLHQGEDFSELARVYSGDSRAAEGGASDWIKKGEMIPEIDQLIFNANPGEVTEIVETSLGYHIFQVIEKKERLNRTLEEVRDETRALLYQKKYEERFNEWMTELKRNAYISIK